MDYNSIRMNRQKTIALIAHDNMKKELIEWIEKNKAILSKHFLCGTGTTARIISDRTDLPVKAFKIWSNGW